MNESEQRGLGEFAAPADGRPDQEAAVVAGDAGQAVSEVVDAADLKFPEAEGTLEMTVSQVDYTVEGSGATEYPVVHVFGRTADNESEHVRVLGMEPYFYVPTEDIEDRALTEEYDAILDSRTENPNGESFQSIRGKPLTKVVGQTPRDVGQIRDDFDEHYEADILFPNRFLIDKDVSSGIQVPVRRLPDGRMQVRYDDPELVATEAPAEADLRVNTFDIEVDDRQGFPEDGEEPIVCLTSHDSYRDEYIVWLYDAPDAEVEAPESLPGYEPIAESGATEVRSFDEEAAMLDAFVEYIEETNPDVLTGWNCLPADSEILLADGSDKPIEEVEVGDRVVGSDEQSTTSAEVTNKWESETEILQFDLADGTDLRTSREHRVMVGDDESVEWKEGGDIEPGEFVLKPRKLAVEEPNVPRLDELVPGENQRYDDEAAVKQLKNELPYGAVSELSETFDISKDVLYRPDPSVWTPERCLAAADEYDVALPDGGTVYRRTGASLERELSRDELYLAGLVLTDGSMSVDNGIRFYNTKQMLHEQFPGNSTLTPDGTGCDKQNVLDYATMYAFNGLGIPFGNKNAGDIDLSAVYELPESYIARFLAGAIDGDGSVGTTLTLAAENPSLGDWYVKLFKRLGVYAERNDNVVRVPDAERDIRILRERVAPHMSHTEKAGELSELSGGKSGRSESIPYALFDAETGSEAKRIGREKHRRDIDLKRHETPVEEWEEYVFVRVDGVDSVGTETTYDIETSTQNFIAEGSLVHNCDDFDMPYVLDRLERIDTGSEYDLDIGRFSRIDEVWRSDWGGPDVKGRVVFDLLYGYKQIVIKELESFRLDAIGERELDVGKEHYSGDIGDLWEQDPEQLLEYNLRDVELCVEIDRKQDVVSFWNQVRSLVGCKLEDAPTAGDAVDMYVLHKAYGEFALPSKGQQEAAEEFEGGAVFEPITGVKENVTVLDLKSLYPMSMATINSSPETKVDPEEYDGETYRSPDGTHFRKEPDGIMREMIDELLTEREEKKKLRDQHEPDTEPYEQYDKQQASVKVVMNCFTPDTDVLTPEGVRNIRELGVGDEVYSLDPETTEMEVKPVTETHAYPKYDGKLIDIQTSKIDFRVTPNHRMLVRKNETNGITEDGYSFVEAGDLDDATNYELPHDWTTDHGDELGAVDLVDTVEGEYEVWVRPEVHDHTFAAELGYYPKKVEKDDVGQEGYVLDAEEFAEHREYIESVCEQSFIHREAGRKWIPRTFDGDDFLDLLAWYITEGNVYTSEAKQFGENHRGSATTVKITQQKPTTADGGATGEEAIATESDHATIGDLLHRMGVAYDVDDRCYQFTSRLLGETLERLCGGDSFEKRIPDFVFDLSGQEKQRFLDTLMAGDGDRQPNSWRYTTSSERLRDDVLRLCAHLGLTANYGKDSGSWRIYVGEDAKNTLRMNRSRSTSTAEDGVYCVTVADNHSLLAGRNGTFQFVGQSLYGVSGWDRFRLYDTEGAAAVTATGREVIEFTETAAEEIDHEVAYGDSVTGGRPVVTRNPDGEVRILPIETLFERASPVENGTVRITADGGPVADATPGKTRAELPGWEALSVNVSGKAEWRAITQAVRHEVDKPVVNFQHKFGESTTTRDHSYVVEDGNELTEAAPADVDEPLRVPDVPSLEERETVDVYDVLEGYSRTYEDGRSVGAENAIEKTKRVHTDGESVWFGHEHHGEIESTPKVKRHIDLNTETGEALIRLLAAYVSEGSASTAETTDSTFGASIAESRTQWLEGLKSDYERLFENVTAGIINSDVSDKRTLEYGTSSGSSSVTDSDATQKLQMMNELSAVFFREFAGQQSHGKRVPSFVFHLPEEQQRLFVDTLVDGDGSREFPRYSAESAERNFDYETVSRELAAGLSMLLIQREKKHSLNYRESKSSYTIRTCDYYRGGQDPVVTEIDHDGCVYDLSVEENENFVDGVGGIVLHNTDSVMLSLGQDVSKAEAIEESFSIEEHINERYDDFAADELNADSHRFEIEFEKLYRRFFQAGKKKRYAGHIIWKEGKDVDDIDITGFEYKRSDIAPITKRVQKKVIDMIVRGEDLEEVKQYLHEVISEFQEGNVDLENVGIPGGIGKRLDAYDTDTAQVRGAKYANLLLGTNFQRGSKPKRLYLKKVHPEFWQEVESGEDPLDPQTDPLYAEFKRDPDVICFEYAEEVPDSFEVDWDKMLDKTLKGPIERVIEALGLSWDEVKSGQEQTGLGQWG